MHEYSDMVIAESEIRAGLYDPSSWECDECGRWSDNCTCGEPEYVATCDECDNEISGCNCCE